MVCDAVLMDKVIGVGTAAILNIDLTATFGLWHPWGRKRVGDADCETYVAYISHLKMFGCRLRNICGLYQPYQHIRMQG